MPEVELPVPVTTLRDGVVWDFPRSVAGLQVLRDFAREHGLDDARVLAGVEVTEARLADAAEVVPASAELTALRNLAGLAAGTPLAGDLGLALGRAYHVTSFGILGYALISSRTVGDVVDLALRFLDLSHIFSTPEVTVVDGEVRIAFEPVDLPADLAGFVVLRDVAAIASVLTELVGDRMPFTSVLLTGSRPADPAPYVEVFGRVPRFRAARAVLGFAVADLERRLPRGNPHSQALAEAMCRDVVSRRRARTGLTEEVRLWITRNVSDGAEMPRAAAALAMSERTLRRRLEGAGTRYQHLLDEVREALAEEMLATGLLGVEDVAQRLGYAEASSFIHAFKRWKGRTPTQWGAESSPRPARPGPTRR